MRTPGHVDLISTAVERAPVINNGNSDLLIIL